MYSFNLFFTFSWPWQSNWPKKYSFFYSSPTYLGTSQLQRPFRYFDTTRSIYPAVYKCFSFRSFKNGLGEEIYTFIVLIFVLLFSIFFSTCSMCSCVFTCSLRTMSSTCFLCSVCTMCFICFFFSGLDDEQIKPAKEIYGAQPRGQRIDHIHDDQPGFEKGCK